VVIDRKRNLGIHNRSSDLGSLGEFVTSPPLYARAPTSVHKHLKASQGISELVCALRRTIILRLMCVKGGLLVLMLCC
jgi:hypothetical protein